MSSEKEKIQILNQMMTMIDTKASKFKSDYKKLTKPQFIAEKRFLLETIESARTIASEIRGPSSTKEVLADLTKLKTQIDKIQQG